MQITYISISDFITYLLSFFIPEIKKDLEFKTIIENQILHELENEDLFINKNYIPLADRY